MKKLLLSFILVLGILVSNAQIIFEVLSPGSIAGGYEIGFTSTAWGFPDMNDPLNAVTADLMLVDAGTAADSAGCTTLVNDLTGKIAVVYRGGCQFGDKAFQAQAAGAVGVLIINNAPTGFIAPGAGTQGGNVNIPVVMVSAADGAIIREEMDLGTVSAYLGTKYLHFGNDLRFTNGYSLLAEQSSTLIANAQDASEFSVELGAWIVNTGFNDQTGVTMTAEISFNGTQVYTTPSTPFDLNSTDSLFVTFPAFSQSTYSTGEYTLVYSFEMAASDEFKLDDSLVHYFRVDDTRFATARLDDNGQAVNSSGIRPASSTQPFMACVVYSDPNASRRSAKGLGFSASIDTTGGVTLDGELIEIYAFEWNDQFTGLSDQAFNITSTNQVGFAEYFFTGHQPNVTVYTDFEEPFNLVDNQRYLFCTKTYSTNVYLGFDAKVDYTYNETNFDQPLMMLEIDGSWSLGFVTPTYPAIVLETGTSIFLGVEENKVEITPYPNPTAEIITIPLTGLDGNASLVISDITGKIVANKQVTVSNSNQLKVNVSDLPGGVYIFNMVFENGTTSSFNVAVSK